MNSSGLIRVLEGVPKFRLRLIELAWEVVDEDGTINAEKATFRNKEIVDAIGESRGYADMTRKAVHCLRQMVR